MSWTNFCVLVWLSLSWRDFITLSDTFRICGHVMDDVITLCWSRESWYDFFLRLGWNFCLGVILYVLVSFYTLVNWILVWFFFALAKFFVFVWFCLIWCCFISWWDQRHLGTIFFRLVNYLVLVWFFSDLESFRILVRLTESWCGLCVLGGDIFST